LILVDANLLVYASVKDMPHHAKALDWLSQSLSSHSQVGIPWASSLAYVRIVTNPRIFPKPLAFSVAWAQVKSWLAQPNVWVPLPTERHQAVLEEMLGAISSCNHVADADLAALAIQYGLELVTADRGFARFPGLRFRNPLE